MDASPTQQELLRAIADIFFRNWIWIAAGDGSLILLTDADIVHDPRHLSALVAHLKSNQLAMVSEMVLRSQSQAIYSPENIGHFGLNLMKYAHFTSPIRRYADLIVHRALVAAGMALARKRRRRQARRSS